LRLCARRHLRPGGIPAQIPHRVPADRAGGDPAVRLVPRAVDASGFVGAETREAVPRPRPDGAGGPARRVVPAADLRRHPGARTPGQPALHLDPMTAFGPADWDGVRLVVFDVDGTLYRQRPLQLRMAR